MTYSKLHASLVNSSLWSEPDYVRILFITLLAMCDKDGYVYGSRIGLERAAMIKWNEDEVDPWTILTSPDPESSDRIRCPENEGRRIEEVSGGFKLLNFAYYRGIRNDDDRREQNRRAQAKFRESIVSLGKPAQAAVSLGKPAQAAVSPCNPKQKQKQKQIYISPDANNKQAKGDNVPLPGFSLVDDNASCLTKTFAGFCAIKLSEGLAAQRVLQPNPNLHNWAATIEKFMATKQISVEHMKRVLRWYIPHIRAPMVKRALCAESFCRHFFDIEDAIGREVEKEAKEGNGGPVGKSFDEEFYDRWPELVRRGGIHYDKENELCVVLGIPPKWTKTADSWRRAK